MIIVLRPDISEFDLRSIERKVRALGHECVRVQGRERSVIAVLGSPRFDPGDVEAVPGVAQVLNVGVPYKLASREVKPENTIVRVGDVEIGGGRIVVMAGPCAVEKGPMLLETARRLAAAGVTVLRGGAFKPRTSPYSFQGLGEEGLRLLAEAREETGLKIVTEVMSPDKIDLVARTADILQIGARNMQNFELLKECARIDKPILLKRGLSASIDEWLQSAEYILAGGRNTNVILCERGIRTFEVATRNTLDLNALPVLAERTHLPVVVDPSHATGRRSYVAAMARAAVAAGADGLLIEVHPDPSKALSDGPQSMTPGQLESLLRDLEAVAVSVGRSVDLRPRRPALPTHVAAAADVAFQGEPNAFSDLAARRAMGPSTRTLPCREFRDVIEAVRSGLARLGLLPIENTLSGFIGAVLDLLPESGLYVVGETRLRIVHHLVAGPGARLEDIGTVYAHPQAALQCGRFLSGHPTWRVVTVYDTSGGARMIRDEDRRDTAALSSAESASALGLKILQQGVEDDCRNFTRFVFVSPAPPEAPEIALLTVEGDPTEALENFRKRGQKVIRIVPRPIPGRPWSYRYFIEVATASIPGALGHPAMTVLGGMKS